MGMTWRQLTAEVDKCLSAMHTDYRHSYGAYCTLGPQSNAKGWTKDDYVVQILNTRQPTMYGLTCVLDAGLCPTHAAMWEAAFPSEPEKEQEPTR